MMVLSRWNPRTDGGGEPEVDDDGVIGIELYKLGRRYYVMNNVRDV
jgi:hypothetical protein